MFFLCYDETTAALNLNVPNRPGLNMPLIAGVPNFIFSAIKVLIYM